MNHATVTLAFYLSLLVLMPIGLALMIWWALKIFKPVVRKPDVDLNEVMFKGVVFMLPGYLALILFSCPAIYFNHLLKQEAVCRQIIEVNKLTATNRDLEEKCGSLDIDELLKNSQAGR